MKIHTSDYPIYKYLKDEQQQKPLLMSIVCMMIFRSHEIHFKIEYSP